MSSIAGQRASVADGGAVLKAGRALRRARGSWKSLAAGAAAAAVAALASAMPALAEALPAQLLLAVVAISAAVGGVGPALAATVVGAAALNYHFEEPYGSWEISSASTLVRLLAFVGLSLLIGALHGRLRRTTEQLEEANRALALSASVDSLTGLANRGALEVALEREGRRASRSDSPLSVLMADIDHFKRFNDTHGHLVGDECLRLVARAVAACARRPGDLAARFGGEEFALVLPDTDASGALAVAHQLHEAVRRLEVPTGPSGEKAAVTISVGAATAPPAGGDSLSPRALLAAADEALYRAKRLGRDRVEAASALAPAGSAADAAPQAG